MVWNLLYKSELDTLTFYKLQANSIFMKNLIILLALFTFVGLSSDMMAQTTAKKASATKVPLSSVQKTPAKKGCCASKKSSCSKTKASATTNVSMTTKAATKKACTKGTKKACCSKGTAKTSCSKDKAQTSTSTTPQMEKIVNKNAVKSSPSISDIRKTQKN